MDEKEERESGGKRESVKGESSKKPLTYNHKT